MFFKLAIHVYVCLLVCEAMTMKQMKNTGKMMRKSCQAKNNAEDDQIDDIMKGVFSEDMNVKCYMACILKMANAVKNGKLSYEQSLKQADMLLPEEIKEGAKSAITNCKNAANGIKDLCDAAFHMTQCIYKENPAIFYFP